jgi:hypothetical protein
MVVVGGASARPARNVVLARSPSLTPAEQKALRVASVKVFATDPGGAVISVRFGGNLEQLIGRGHLKNAVVAVVLRPKSSTLAPAAVATVGAGQIGGTLHKTHSNDVAVIRSGSRFDFMIGGPGAAGVKVVQVRTWRSWGRWGNLGSIPFSPSPSAEFWEGVEKEQAANAASLPFPTVDNSCDELAGMYSKLQDVLTLESNRVLNLQAQKERFARVIPRLEQDAAEHQYKRIRETATAAVLGAGTAVQIAIGVTVNPIAGVGAGTTAALAKKRLDEARTEGEKAQAASDLIRSLKLDMRLADALLEKSNQLVTQIKGLLKQANAAIGEKCGKKTTPPPTQDYAYMFSNLQLSFDSPLNKDTGMRHHIVESFTGVGCGTPTDAQFKGSEVVTMDGGSPLSLAWAAPLKSGESAVVDTRTFNVGSTGDIRTSISFKGGASPTIGLIDDFAGDIINVSRSPDVALTVKPVPSC